LHDDFCKKMIELLKNSTRSLFRMKKIARNALYKRFRMGEFVVEQMIKGTSFISFAFIILIFVFVFREALPIFSTSTHPVVTTSAPEAQETYGETPAQALADQKSNRISAESAGAEGIVTVANLSGKQWQPVSSNPRYGLLPLFFGSFKVSIIAVFIGAPLAILAALFTASFAPRWAKEILKPSIELLAGIPSVVLGFFALIVIASWVQNLFGLEYRLNAFVGGIALALSVIPIIYTISEDALASVPKTYTEASLALGATKWQTALFVVLPAATPGVFAAVLLGIGRAFGETMIVLMATGNAALTSLNPFEPVRTMSATIGAEMAEVVFR
jgi:phosphate transport system permease protein